MRNLNHIKIKFKTNLDLFQESWPDALPAIPVVGDLIFSGTLREGRSLCLQVHTVRWLPLPDSLGFQEWTPEIELHLVSDRWGSIRAFYEWYAPFCGQSVGAFI
jgi:hypothetical protein